MSPAPALARFRHRAPPAITLSRVGVAMTVMFEEGGFSARQLQRSVSPKTVSVDGARGWLVVAVAFLANVVAFGITYSFGVMFESLSTEFDAGRGATAAG